MADRLRIIRKVTEKGISEFEKHSGFTNTDEGKKMIVFCTKELKCSDVGNWGRQESQDAYIGLDENGWIRYEHTVQYHAGPLKISNPSIKRLTENEVLEYIDSTECTDDEFLSFWSHSKNLF